jgi:hypothetical protein
MFIGNLVGRDDFAFSQWDELLNGNNFGRFPYAEL